MFLFEKVCKDNMHKISFCCGSQLRVFVEARFLDSCLLFVDSNLSFFKSISEIRPSSQKIRQTVSYRFLCLVTVYLMKLADNSAVCV